MFEEISNLIVYYCALISPAIVAIFGVFLVIKKAFDAFKTVHSDEKIEEMKGKLDKTNEKLNSLIDDNNRLRRENDEIIRINNRRRGGSNGFKQ